MNKTGLVISREYFSRVKKKSFLITTIVVPLVIVAFYAAIIAISISGSNSSKSFAIIDDAGIFATTPESKSGELKFTLIKNETESSFVKKYKDAGYDALVYIPQMHIDTPKNMVIHSPSTVSLSTSSRLESMINAAIEDKRLLAYGIDPLKYKQIQSNVSLTNKIDTEEGSKDSSAGVAFAVSFVCGLLIYMMMLIYGTMVMRGVMEEKTNRIAEVIVSSVKPFQLMMGKIIGIGLVGLTQFAVWIIIFLLMQLAIPFIFPDLLTQMNAATSIDESSKTAAIAGIMQSLSALPLFKIFGLFIFYFIGGYLTYASLFAAIGSVVSDDQNDAQQLIFPVMMPIILGFVILTRAINDPNSSLAVFGSLFPLTSPIVMMGRVTFDIPVWELLASMALLVGCFFFLTWLTAKIYRTGILMYGKKPSWKEMLKWAFRKA
ncbi:MAG: ABC transporter permease [Ferruginibacter sp.]|nr:ABC transporter permease [Ferruginibacter sp.]